MPAPIHTAKTIDSVVCAVLTVSDSRIPENDESGRLIRQLLAEKNHRIHHYEIVPDEPGRVRERLIATRDDPACQAVLVNGGTGIAARDTTVEAVESLLEKRIDGFGELFRARSFADIGPAAMLSRAVAGVMSRTIVFSMPGSPAAVRLAMEALILPELPHVAYLLSP